MNINYVPNKMYAIMYYIKSNFLISYTKYINTVCCYC